MYAAMLTLTVVDLGEPVRTIFRRRRTNYLAGIIFCETCEKVCDRRCRADAIRERARTEAFTLRAGLR